MVASHELSILATGHPRFDALAFLARTPAGELLRTRDRLRGEDVALWVIPRQATTPAALAAFRDVFLALRHVDHPHLAQVLDLGSTDETFFYTRELVAGESIPGRRGGAGTGSPRPCGIDLGDEHVLFQWLSAFAGALGALHAAGLVHGFIIPQHLHATADHGQLAGVWLTEAGSHLLVPPQLAAPFRRYFSPEVRAGASPTPASDLYSLGAVLLAAMEGAAAPRGRGRDAAVPEFRALLTRLLATDPAGRPADGRALGAWLRDPAWILPDRRLAIEHLLSPLLVGQRRAIAAACSLLTAAAAGNAHAGEIVGEAGSGRSRLLATIAGDAWASGWTTAWVGGRAGGRALDDLKDAVLQALGPSEPGLDAALALANAPALAPALAPANAPELAPANAPELAPGLAAEPSAIVPAYAQISGAILGALARSGRRLVLLVDDAADLAPDVIATLKHLVTEAGSLPILVLTTGLQPAGLPDAQIIATQRLEERDLRRLAAPLLAAALNPEPLFTAIQAAANGNPLWVRVLLATWLESGRLRYERGRIFFDERAGAPVPATIEAVVHDLLDRLDPRARELVEIMAVWGRPLSRELATKIAGSPLSVPEALVTSGDAAIARVPREGHQGHDLRFLADAFAPVVLRVLAADRRRSRHEAILAALDGMAVEPGVRAPHLFATGQIAAAVADLVTAAERAAATGALHTALAHYRMALDHTADLAPQTVERTAIALAAARLAVRLGELTESRAVLAQVAPPDDDPSAPPGLRLELLLLRAHVLRERRLTQEAAAAYSAARALAGAHPVLAPELVQIDIEEAANDFCANRWREGLERLAPRLAALEGAGGPLVALATALNRMAALRSAGGEERAAALCALRAARIARGAADLPLAARALVNLGHIYQQLGLPHRAIRALDRARSILARCPHEGLRASELTHRGQVLLALGDFAAAESALLHARAIRLRTGDHGRLPAILIGLGRLLRHSGRLGAAEAHYEQALAIADEFALPAAHTARGLLGELLLWQGEWREAERLLRAALVDARPEVRGLCRRNLATLLRWRGRFPAALAALAACRRDFGSSAERQALALIECVRVHLAAGDQAAAELCLAEAKAAAASADATLRAEYHLARGLVEVGARLDPRPALTTAIAMARETADPTFLGQVLIDAIRGLLDHHGAEAVRVRSYLEELEGAAARTDARYVASESRALRGEVAARFPPPAAGDVLAAEFVRHVVEQGKSAEETLLGELVLRLGGTGGALLLAVGLTADGKLSLAPVKTPSGSPATTVRPYRVAAREFDRRLFKQALAVAGGNVPEAARLLCLPESTFRYRATKLKLLGRAARSESS